MQNTLVPLTEKFKSKENDDAKYFSPPERKIKNKRKR